MVLASNAPIHPTDAIGYYAERKILFGDWNCGNGWTGPDRAFKRWGMGLEFLDPALIYPGAVDFLEHSVLSDTAPATDLFSCRDNCRSLDSRNFVQDLASHRVYLGRILGAYE